MGAPVHNCSGTLRFGFQTTFLMKVIAMCVFPLGTQSPVRDSPVQAVSLTLNKSRS